VIVGAGPFGGFGTLTKCRDVGITPDDLYVPLALGGAQNDPVLRIIQPMGLARPIDLEARGVSRAQLYSLVRKGFAASFDTVPGHLR